MLSIISIIYTVTGVLYTFFAGKGKVFCYFFGLISTLCYSYLTLKNNFLGNFLLNISYYLPMQIIGIFLWKKHLKKDKKEIIKTKLNKKEFRILCIVTFIITVTTILILKLTSDKSPILDGITTILSIAGMYLTVRRCIEQWCIWIIVNLLTIIMWLKVALTNPQTFPTIIVWTIYLYLGIHFYLKWKKELDNQ